MTTTTAHSKQKAFSLVELLIVTTVLGFFVMIATSSMLALSKSSTSLVNYQEMNEQGRHMLERFARDLRSASTVVAISDTSIQLECTPYGGSQQSVSYTYNAQAGLLFRQVDSQVHTIILDDLSAFDLTFYTFRGEETSNPIEAKRVVIQAIIERSSLSTKNTHFIISAQFVLRNHRVTS